MVLSGCNPGAHSQSNDPVKSLNGFSFNLYKQLSSKDNNMFFSPLSTYLAISMAYEGSKGETKKEFQKVFYLSEETRDDNFIKIINGENFKSDSSFILSNALWAQKQFSIENKYKNDVQRKYSAQVYSINFLKKDSAAAKINNWVLKSTNGLIKNMIDPGSIDSRTKIVITSSVYFDGKWKEKFDKNQTKKDKFYTSSTVITPTYFMNKTEFLNYYENNQLQFVSIPYKNSQLSFCIILPSANNSLGAIEQQLKPAFLDTMMNNMRYSKVKISIPKFKMEADYSLKKSLNRIGLRLAFTKKADFSGISKKGELLINSIKHKAYIDVNEEKTKAAATSIVSMIAGSSKPTKEKPKILIADHPFIFLILNTKTKGIIFMGKFVKPD